MKSIWQGMVESKRILLYLSDSVFRFLSIRLLFLLVPMSAEAGISIMSEYGIMILFMIILPGIEMSLYFLIKNAFKEKWIWMSFRIVELIYYVVYVIWIMIFL